MQRLFRPIRGAFIQRCSSSCQSQQSSSWLHPSVSSFVTFHSMNSGAASFHSTSKMLSSNALTSHSLLEPEEIVTLTERSRQIFGHLPMSNVRTGQKVLRKKLIGPLVTKDHHKSLANELRSVFPEFQTDVEERRKAKLAYLRRRGKGPPKKGEGKRAAKRGKKK